MALLDLPVEIILIIIKYLDLKSIQSIYNTCRYMRDVVCMQGSVKQCHMSINSMATAKTLKLKFFKDISGHLQELNMSGVPNLYKTAFYPALKKFKSLITLDVSYTYLNLDDLREVCRSCPTLKNICININISVSKDMLSGYQDDFQQLENVHFIGSLMHYNSALLTLEKAKIDTFKFTILGKLKMQTYENAKCKKLIMYFFNLGNTEIVGVWKRLPSLLTEKRNVEYIVINKSNLSKYYVCASVLFKKFFSDEFGLDTEFVDILYEPLRGNTLIMFFDNEHIKFDDIFFCKLSKELRRYLPYFCKSNVETLASDFEWFYIIPAAQDMELNDSNDVNRNNGPVSKKKRIGEPNFVLNYDVVFKEKQKVKLSVGFREDEIRNAVSLNPSSDYLKKLTFLSISGRTCYSPNFFKILFQNCTILNTLDVECHFATSQWTSDIAKYIPLSKCLKNVRLIGSRIKFNTLFLSLSKCKTLEKIHIEDSVSYSLYSNEIPVDFGDPSILIEKCDNLYSLYIDAPIPVKARIKISQKLNKTKSKLGKCYLNFVFLCKCLGNMDRGPLQTFPSNPLPFDLFRY